MIETRRVMALLREGEWVRDTYEVERFLGEGAFAEVYRVNHRFLGRQALKMFKRAGMQMEEIKKMLGEATLLSKIGHPNIVRVFDANVLERGGICHGYFTMENVSGGTLDKFWKSHGSKFVPVETTVELLMQVCRGLCVAHGEDPPIIHRDIKPQNILIGYEATGLRARLSDFGLARQVDSLTLMASAAGTLAFKPPEVFANKKADSPRADIYALGVTLYMLLTDRFPYEIDEGIGWASVETFDAKVLPPSSINFDVDQQLDDVVMKCIVKESSHRFKNANELLAALSKWKRPAVDAKNMSLSDNAKKLFGDVDQGDAKGAQRLVREAMKMAQEEGKLMEAADMMEEAFNKAPGIREKYASRIKLWRAGISM